MFQDPNKLINNLDTVELFAQLIGQIVINHQKIIKFLRKITLTLEDDLQLWRTGRFRRRVLGEVRVFRKDESIAAFTKNINTLSDSDIIRFFELILCDWHNVQHRFIGKPNWFSDYPDTLLKCLRDENTIRNHLIHSDFEYKDELVPLEQIQVSRNQTGEGKKRGTIGIRTVQREEMIQFLQFQNLLFEHLEEIFYEFEYGDRVGFLVDCAFVEENKSDFDIEVVDYIEGDNWLALPDDLSEQNQIFDYFMKFQIELKIIEEMRKVLEIKIGNYNYEWKFPT